MHVFYLHGFASSPASSKAEFLSARFAEAGIALHCPDFNEPDFSTLTMSRMLSQLDAAIDALPPGPVALIGSSLGGFVAVEAVARRIGRTGSPTTAMVLLAPAVELAWDRWQEVGAGGVDRWRESGSIEIFHYAQNAPRRLNYTFYTDACQYDPASRTLDVPMVIVQGSRDVTVDPVSVERFSRAQPRSTLHMVDDEHQLKNSLPFIWRVTARALEIT